MKANVIFKLKVSRKVNTTQEVIWSFRIIREKNNIIRAQFWYEHERSWEYYFAPDAENITDLSEYLKSPQMFDILQTGAMH